MIAKQIATGSIVPLGLADTCGHALSVMEDLRLVHLPVADEHQYLGLIAEKDLHALPGPEMEIGQVKNFLIKASIGESDHIFDAFRIISSQALSLLPVVTIRNQYIGAILLPDLVTQFSAISAIHNPGGVIVLEINSKDYSINEISRIVESSDARILNLFVTSFPDSTRLEITMKVDLMDIGPLVHAFNRYNYLIKATWSHQDAYHEGLQERFDALMNYLSIRASKRSCRPSW